MFCSAKGQSHGGCTNDSGSSTKRWNRFHSSYRPSRRDLQGTIEEILGTTRCVVVSIMASLGSSRTTGRRRELQASKGNGKAATQSYIRERGEGGRAVAVCGRGGGHRKEMRHWLWRIDLVGEVDQGRPSFGGHKRKQAGRVGLWEKECQHGHQHHVLPEASRWPAVLWRLL